MEIGAGLAVPTIRHIAELTAEKFEKASLVRIHLDDTGIPEELGPERTVVLPLGALKALSEIEEVLLKDRPKEQQ